MFTIARPTANLPESLDWGCIFTPRQLELYWEQMYSLDAFTADQSRRFWETRKFRELHQLKTEAFNSNDRTQHGLAATYIQHFRLFHPSALHPADVAQVLVHEVPGFQTPRQTAQHMIDMWAAFTPRPTKSFEAAHVAQVALGMVKQALRGQP